jgi:predicted nucleic acid-binding protein
MRHAELGGRLGDFRRRQRAHLRLAGASPECAALVARGADVVRQLTRYQASVEAIPAMGIDIFPVDETTILLGLRHQRRYGLLTNDSLIVASVHEQAVRSLATADERLRIVDDIELFVPTDLSGS